MQLLEGWQCPPRGGILLTVPRTVPRGAPKTVFGGFSDSWELGKQANHLREEPGTCI